MRPFMRLFSVTALIAIFACSNTTGRQVFRNISHPERMGLAVLNFRNTTPKERAEQFQPWEYGIAAMLMTDINSIGLFEIVSRERLKDILKEQSLQHSGLVDKRTAVQVGKLIAAHYILTGSFTEMNGVLRIEAQVFSVEKGTQLGAASVKGETSRFFEIEKELVFKISLYLKALLTEEEKSKLAMNVETKSVEASLNNYAGEIAVMKADDLIDQGKKDAANAVLQNARKKFQKALEADPKYERAKKNLAKLVMGIPLTL